MVLIAAFFLAAATSDDRASRGDEILGLWKNQEKDAVIEIYKCGEKYCGRVFWTKFPNYSADDALGRGGQRRLDDKNPDPELRNRPIEGLKIMEGFVFDGKGEWKKGSVYDPKNGKTYGGKMFLISPDELHLRGYVLFSFFGRTAIWTRSRR
jgi:uncharacterized protein (DUF2147 family)